MFPNRDVEVKGFSAAEELSGKMQFSGVDEKLMHAVIENDQDTITDGKLIESMLNRGISSFTPSLMLKQYIQNYALAENIYGDTLLQFLSGYDAAYIKKNINIPEFQQQLQKKMEEKISGLKKQGLLTQRNDLTEKGIELAALVVAVEELKHILPRGIRGERIHKKRTVHGAQEDVKPFRKGDRYKDIAVRSSIKTAVRRGHSTLMPQDLRAFERQSKGQCYMVYALDASGSMKGKKIGLCKRAGIALAYKAIQDRDKVGLIVFGDDVKTAIEPTENFSRLLKEIIAVRASNETDLASTIKRAITLFPNIDVTKHLLLLTDTLPTVGKNPQKETLEQCAIAAANNITISLIGINMDRDGRMLAEKIVEIGKGKLYAVRDLDELDVIVLEDYYMVR